MSKSNNPQVFPVSSSSDEGITLRDYFAAKAMQGIIGNGGYGSYEQNAMIAYNNADAMLAEREKRA